MQTKYFVCNVCSHPTDSKVKSSVDIDGGYGNEFCNFKDMLSVDGDADEAAVTSGIHQWLV